MNESINFPIQAAPSPGEVLEVAPGILWTRFTIPFQLNYVNVYLIEDDDGWTAVDAAIDGKSTRSAWRLLLDTQLGGRPIRRLIISHFHPDHIGAAKWLLEQTGAELVMTDLEYRAAQDILETDPKEDEIAYRKFYADRGVGEEYLEEVVENLYTYSQGVGGLPKRETTIAARHELRIGGRTFEVLTGSGHSPEQAMLYDHSNLVLLCADQVLARISPNISVFPGEPDANPLGNYLNSLTSLRDDVSASALVLPGHDLPFLGLHRRIGDLHSHHMERCRLIEEACLLTALTATELVPQIFRRGLDPWQFGLAIAETLAHVNLLVSLGRVEPARAKGKLRYRTVQG